MKKRTVLSSVFLAILFAVLLAPALSAWEPAENILMTEWGEKVTPENAWREYPRPQLVRDLYEKWQNLNGLWDYAITPRGSGIPEEWDGKILVPYPVESALSGVKRLLKPDEEIWYRRTFKGDARWIFGDPGLNRERLLLHFGAVDFRTQVFLNGVEVTAKPHEGGILPFTLDVTDYVKPFMPSRISSKWPPDYDSDPDNNELVVCVWDPTDEGMQATGKQALNPNGCFYSRVSGIWQTVWLERVPRMYIESYHVVPDIDAGTVAVTVKTNGNAPNAKLAIHVTRGERPGRPSLPRHLQPRLGSGETVIAETVVTDWSKPVVIPIVNPERGADLTLWSPETPNLYTITFELTFGTGADIGRDNVKGYFGMRKIEWKPDELGVPRFYLNNKKYFMYGTLDQGWWPDGLLTPPSEQAMRADIRFLKDAGFNMHRKHIKVEPLSYYTLCDTMGILVWQDMPSGPGDADKRYAMYRHDLREMVDMLQTFPSIVMWVPYNESWGQPGAEKTNMTLNWLKKYDPSRLVDGPSGWNDYGVGDARDMHHYPDAAMFPVMKDRVSVLGEFGGLGLDVPGHLWEKEHWGYVHDDSADAFKTHYRELMKKLAVLASEGLAAAVYTQTTDVERETNGLLTYDRKVVKYPADELAKLHSEVYKAAEVTHLRVDVPLASDSRAAETRWRSTETEPADDWISQDFDDSAWNESAGAFGNDRILEDFRSLKRGTKWESEEIWLRREFTIDEDPAPFFELILTMFYDEDPEIWLNGIKTVAREGYNTRYETFVLPEEACRALKQGRNVLAVHVRNAEGGAFFDIGLKAVKYRILPEENR